MLVRKADQEEISFLGHVTWVAIHALAGDLRSRSLGFRPTRLGFRSAILSLIDTAPGDPHAISLSGTGLGARIAVSASRISFGRVRPRSRARQRTVRLSTSGNLPLVLRRLRLNGKGAKQFSVRARGCTRKSIRPGRSCTIEVIWRPGSTKTASSMLSMISNALAPPPTVRLTGRTTGR
jgi:hypothetical protein